MKKLYFDYASSTPVNEEVKNTFLPYFSEKFGNGGSPHSFGQEAIKAIDISRESIAKAINAEFREVIFTTSATEANNLCLRGVVKASKIEKPKIIISAIEHSSILHTTEDMQKENLINLEIIPVSKEGIIDTEKLQESLDKNTVLVSVMYVNNELGSIQPLKEIQKIIESFNEENESKILFHSDAVQGLQFLNCDVKDLELDFATFSSHKIYGPKGSACLYIKDEIKDQIKQITTGGTQEFGFKAGTVNVPAVVGFGKATELIKQNQQEKSQRVKELKEKILKGIKEIYPEAKKNGTGESAPHILNIYFPNKSAQEFLIKLDMKGVAVSTGSACASRAVKPSHVLGALGFSNERVNSSIRFSLGEPTTEEEVKKLLDIIKEII
ncbi:MAG: cysteine desulfurase family protein [Candidatus Paceibacterota bacterium]